VGETQGKINSKKVASGWVWRIRKVSKRIKVQAQRD
jgi:hypothetical protein